MKGSVLELGGKDPQIVCADADLANAVSGTVWGGFANAGQTCSGIERAYVVEEVADEFIEGVVRETERLTVGDPLDWETEIGPMVSARPGRPRQGAGRRRDRRAAPSGSTGGPQRGQGYDGPLHRPDRPDRGHPRDADHARGDLRPGAADHRGRQRGRGDQARQRLQVRARRLGLDQGPRARASAWPAEIESGMVWINDHSFSHGACQCAWGGVKESGLGRSHSKFGFYECVERQARSPGSRG